MTVRVSLIYCCQMKCHAFRILAVTLIWSVAKNSLQMWCMFHGFTWNSTFLPLIMSHHHHLRNGSLWAAGPIRRFWQIGLESDHVVFTLCLWEISHPGLDVSSVWTPIIAAKSENYNSFQCCIRVKIVFKLVPPGEFVSLVMSSILVVLWF
jgi:hypothetical protein